MAKALHDLRGLYHKMGSNSETGGRQASPRPPPECRVKSAVGEEDVVVSGWFVGVQQGEALSDSAQCRCPCG